MQISIRNFKKKAQRRIKKTRNHARVIRKKNQTRSEEEKDSDKKSRIQVLFDGIFLDSPGKIRSKQILQKDKIRFFRQETCIEGMEKES